MSGSSLGGNALLKIRARGEWSDWFKVTESHNNETHNVISYSDELVHRTSIVVSNSNQTTPQWFYIVYLKKMSFTKGGVTHHEVHLGQNQQSLRSVVSKNK